MAEGFLLSSLPFLFLSILVWTFHLIVESGSSRVRVPHPSPIAFSTSIWLRHMKMWGGDGISLWEKPAATIVAMDRRSNRHVNFLVKFLIVLDHMYVCTCDVPARWYLAGSQKPGPRETFNWLGPWLFSDSGRSAEHSFALNP